jgi:hypothetical protein
MTFLNTALLAALSLGLIPILIHLLNRQRFKQVDFPTLRFLREMQRQKMRQVKIRQIILLVLRTLAVLFLVLALTRPVIKSAAGILPGVEAKSTSILILDRSASMQTETPTGSRFRDIQTRAQEILASMSDGDEIQIIWADTEPVLFPEAPSSHIALIRDAISDAEVTSQGGNLVEAFQAARRVLGNSQNLHKEVYVLSDFSGSAWPERMPDIKLLPDDVRLFLLSGSNETLRNLGITNARITSRLITPGRPVELAIEVFNSGNVSSEDRIISVYVGGRRVAQTRATQQAGRRQEYRLKFVPEEPGSQTGYVRLEDPDDYAADDRREFVLRVPPRLQVALVGADGPACELTALALNPASDPDAFVQVSKFTPAEFETSDWSSTDAIVVVDAPEFGIGFENRIREFVESGKGVMVIPGPQFNLRAHQKWMAGLGLPGLVEVKDAESSPYQWGQTDLTHPIFEGLFEQAPSVISPDFNRIVTTTGTGTAVNVISFSNGAPFMLESRAGRGRAILILSSPDPQWASLFRSGIFPPLMVSGAAYLSGIGTSGEEYQVTVGAPSQLSFTGRPGSENFEIRRDEWSATLGIETGSSGYTLKIPPLSEAGSYDLRQGNRKIGVVAANVPASESNIAQAPAESYEEMLGGRITELGNGDNVKNAINEGRFGRELWKLCLYLALAMLIAEMLVGRVGRREAAVTV